MTRSSIAERLLVPGALRTFFQPIFRLDALAEPAGYEALTRGPAGSTMEEAAVLFEYVRLKGLEAEFDRRCVEAALVAARALPNGARLALNVHAATLERDAEFVDFLIERAARAEIAVARLTLEIVEHVPIHLGLRLNGAIDRLRSAGAAIAIDDFGSGQANFRLLLELRPEFLKVDRYLVHGCHADAARCAVLRAVAELAAGIGATTVAEGVEELEDLMMVTGLGFEQAQGFLLGEPLELPLSEPASAVGSWKLEAKQCAVAVVNAVGVSASAILDAVPTGVMAADRAGALRYANPTARQLFGLADAGAEGCDLAELLGGAPDLRRALLGSSGSGESRHELRLANDAGEVRVVGLTVVRPPRSSHPELGAVVLFRDVAERREALLDGSQLERWWALGRMVADMAHEVRNPLAALQFLTEALAAELTDEPRAGDYVCRILETVARIDVLVCSAIAFAEPARPQPEQLSVASLIQRALARVDGASGLMVGDGEELAAREVFADADQVSASLAKLIENALDATGSTQRVALRLTGERERSGRGSVRIDVLDDGPGITPDVLSRVFDPFFTTRPNRTGMGLAFAQMLARQNGGRVLARSTPGIETVFSLVVPENAA